RREADDLVIFEVRYEVPLDQCQIAVIRAPEIRAVTPRGIEFPGGILRVMEAGCVINGDTPPPAQLVDQNFTITNRGADGYVIHRADQPLSSQQCNRLLHESEDYLTAHLAATPKVRDSWQPMVSLCWWVLGNNTLRLGGAADSRAVVPSKLGYVGLWQWDSYFIALGLRHGDRDLAREIMDLALAYPTGEGQLPDVVHEEGILASSRDLPASDRETLLRQGSPAPGLGSVPLTKPPLTAWVIHALYRSGAISIADVRRWLPVTAASQDWWFRYCDPDGCGYPAYLHPYSSGLDDSPVFDATLPVSTPDLGAYLVLQDQVLAELYTQLGDENTADTHRNRAEVTCNQLLKTWDVAREQFRPAPRTIVHLMPLLTGALPPQIHASLLRDLDDPKRFGAPYRLPTVAQDEPSFQPRRMWRGPVWVNTNYLVADGLRRSGEHGRAERLELETIELVLAAGGPYEYFEAATARPGDRATSCFGWSAALFVDLAVRHSA
ncbi:MAG: hypothetical protein Q4Q03_05790, partial [Bowdeniella nasicola]|nr:hypothetical protein [Bowdeniella nasicola]